MGRRRGRAKGDKRMGGRMKEALGILVRGDEGGDVESGSGGRRSVG